MGDDSRNEYIYKYVSNANWDPADANERPCGRRQVPRRRQALRREVQRRRHGQLAGAALRRERHHRRRMPPTRSPIRPMCCINARLAADAAGAHARWTGRNGARSNPMNGDGLHDAHEQQRRAAPARGDRRGQSALLQRPDAPPAPRSAAIPTATSSACPRTATTPAATSFRWDIFLFGARSTADAANVNVSGLTADNDFSSPDGCGSGASGLCWIQTDDGAYTDVTNCMLLAAVPGTVGDGAKRTITNIDGAATKAVDTFVGRAAGRAKLRRFLVGPEGVRDHRHRRDAGRQDAVRQHPASRRGDATAASATPAPSPATGPDGGARARARRPSSSRATTAAKSAGDSPDVAASHRRPRSGPSHWS